MSIEVDDQLTQAKSEGLHEESRRSYGKNKLDPVLFSDLSYWPKLRANNTGAGAMAFASPQIKSISIGPCLL